MTRVVLYLRLSLLVLALALTTVALAPAPAAAAKSCQYYCGPPGPDSCPHSPPSLNCFWYGQ